MTKKRRSDKYHDIGDSKPGTVGDKRPSMDKGDTPMERIHYRRHGELSVPQPSEDHCSNHREKKKDDENKDEKKYTGEYSDQYDRVEHIPL